MTLLERAQTELSEVGRTKYCDIGWMAPAINPSAQLKAWAEEEGVSLKFDYSKPTFVYVSLRKQV